MMPKCYWVTASAVLACVWLLGCQATPKQVKLESNPYYYSQEETNAARDQVRLHLLNVIRDVCLDDPGAAAKIDESVRLYSAGSSFLGQSYIGGKKVTSTVYPLTLGEYGHSWLLNLGGKACGIATERSLRFPPVLRKELNISMQEPVWDMFSYEDVDVTFGQMKGTNTVLRQYSLPGEEGKLIDFVEFLTPEAMSEDVLVISDMRKLVENLDDYSLGTETDLVVRAVEQVCAPNLSDKVAMMKAAESLSGSKGFQSQEFSLNAIDRDFAIHALSKRRDGTFSFLVRALDGSGCGYVDVGAKEVWPDLFAILEAVDINRGMIANAATRVGYSAPLKAMVFEGMSESEDMPAHMFMILSERVVKSGKLRDIPLFP